MQWIQLHFKGEIALHQYPFLCLLILYTICKISVVWLPEHKSDLGKCMLPSGPLPLLKSKQRRAFWFSLSSCLLLCLWAVYICWATCAAWMKKGMGFEMHLLLHVNAGLVSEPGATNATPEWFTKVSSHPGRCMVLGERNSSEFRSLQSRNALPAQALTQKMVFSFSEAKMLPSHWYRDRQSSKIWQISADTCWHNGRSLAKKHLTNLSLYIIQSISYFLSTVLLTVMYCTNLTTEMA